MPLSNDLVEAVMVVEVAVVAVVEKEKAAGEKIPLLVQRWQPCRSVYSTAQAKILLLDHRL